MDCKTCTIRKEDPNQKELIEKIIQQQEENSSSLVGDPKKFAETLNLTEEDMVPIDLTLTEETAGITQVANAIKALAITGPAVDMDADHRAALVLVPIKLTVKNSNNTIISIRGVPGDWLITTTDNLCYVIKQKDFEKKFNDFVERYYKNYSGTGVETQE